MGISVEYGNCAQCGDNNVKSAQSCRKCAAPLPWSKAAAPPKAAPTGGISAAVNEIAWGAMAVQILGGLIFLAGIFLWCGNKFDFYPTFPLAGYITASVGGVIWRVGSEL